MMEKKQYLIVTFYTTAAAMAAEKRCREKGVGGKLISVPRHITAECGLAWRCEPDSRSILESLLSDLDVERYYVMEL